MAIDFHGWNVDDSAAAAALGACVGAIGTLLTAGVAWFQLNGIRKDSKINGWQVLITLESEVSIRNKRLTDISTEINNQPDKINELLSGFNIAKEDYFNALDRLSFFIRKKYLLSKNEWKAEYEKLILGTVAKFEADFGEDSSFQNVKAVYETWKPKCICKSSNGESCSKDVS